MKQGSVQQLYIRQLMLRLEGMSGVVCCMRTTAPVLFLLIIFFYVSTSLHAQSNTYFRTETGVPYVPVLPAAPSSPTVGSVYINSADKVIYKAESSQWVPVGSGVAANTMLSPASALYKGQSVAPYISYISSGGLTSSNCAVTGCSYVWYRADDAAGTNKAVIFSGTGTPAAYTVTGADVGKYIGLGVTPVTACNAPAFESVSWKNVSTLTPSVTSVTVTGQNGSYAIKGSVLTASFTGYNCSPVTITGDAGSASTYQWYYATDAAGTGKTVISGKTAFSYTVSFSDGYSAGKYIAVGVTPIAANGDAGTETISTWYPTSSLVPAYNAASIVGLTGGKAQNNTTLAAVTGIYSVTPAVTGTEGTPTYKWYYATDASGTGKTAITGQTARTHTVNIGNGYGYTSDAYYLAVGVTPVTTTGETGAEVLSGWVKIQIVRNSDGTFVNELVSPSGRVWMDRNLGATQAATSPTDYLAYGSLYQWCRAADGHEKINWSGYNAGTPANGTTTALSSSTTPGHSLFILCVNNSPYDWLSTQQSDGSLWWNGTVTGANNPCPMGYHVPTYTEWNAELTVGITNVATAYSILKLPEAGFRRCDVSDGTLYYTGSYGGCWSSTVNGVFAYSLIFGGVSPSMNNEYRAFGISVRCIKN